MVDETIRQNAISIHPPLAGRDVTLCRTRSQAWSNFNPPAPRGTGQSRLTPTDLLSYFNPPAPRGTGRIQFVHELAIFPISIHPPLAGRDRRSAGQKERTKEFQSTRPSRDGTTESGYCAGIIYHISIHPPLAGRDFFLPKIDLPKSNFNPPAPRGTGRLWCR